MSLLNELRQRNVLRVAAAYIVASWLVIQVVETLFPIFGLSDATIRTVVIVLGVGFIPVAIFAWAFQLTPEGLKLDKEVDRTDPTAMHGGKTLDRVIMVVLALALGYFAFDKFVLDPARDAELVEDVAETARNEALLESFGDKSIAVLPFVDMSPNSDQEYMSDGIAEELLNLLAKIPDLRVVSRSSAFAYKGKDINITDVANELNVAYVLEGSVRLAGDQVRITAQLIDAGTDSHLWSETYDRKFENIFAIQDDISARVVDELKVTLLGDAPQSKPIDEQAYKLALQARYLWNRRADGDSDKAFELYKQVLEIAPDFAPAWAGISVAYRDQIGKGRIPPDEGWALAKEAAEKALALDPNLADAHLRMGNILGAFGDSEGRAKAYARALELEPNNPLALMAKGQSLIADSKYEEALEYYQRAEVVDPLGSLWPANSFYVYAILERYEEAEAAARRAYELNGRELNLKKALSFLYILQERYQDVLDIWAGEQNALPDDYLSEFYMQQAVALHGLGRLQEAEQMARKLETIDQPYKLLDTLAMYALQGDLDTAFEYLEEASRQFPRSYVDWVPYLKRLRDDPRWDVIIAKFDKEAPEPPN